MDAYFHYSPSAVKPYPVPFQLIIVLYRNFRALITCKAIKHGMPQSGEPSIDISTLVPGLYLMLLSDEGIRQHIKITKQ